MNSLADRIELNAAILPYMKVWSYPQRSLGLTLLWFNRQKHVPRTFLPTHPVIMDAPVASVYETMFVL